MPTTTIAIKKLPPGLAKAVLALSPKGHDIKIETAERATPSCSSQAYTCANALVTDLDNPASVTVRRGVWGGDNGFNKAPADSAWDPVFDREAREVPIGGAILVGMVGRWCSVYVHPTTFAERWIKHDVARDAVLEGRADEACNVLSEATPLTDEECAILYAHKSFKSGEYRKRVVAKYTSALESCVARGLIKRANNGACTITTEGKALEDLFRKRGESLAWKA